MSIEFKAEIRVFRTSDEEKSHLGAIRKYSDEWKFDPGYEVLSPEDLHIVMEKIKELSK